MKSPGRFLVLAGSIILIIFAALFILIPVFNGTRIVLDGVFITLIILLLGVLGIKWWNNHEKSMYYIITGVVFFAFWLIFFILETLLNNEVSISNMLLFVHSALFIIGGIKHRQFYFLLKSKENSKG